MQPDAIKHLRDVQTAAGWITQWATGRTEVEFAADEMFRSAVERKFEIIGEALNRLRRDDPVAAGRITAIQRIIGFRNVLIHGYDVIDDEISWDAVEIKLPVLRAEVDALLSGTGVESEEE